MLQGMICKAGSYLGDRKVSMVVAKCHRPSLLHFSIWHGIGNYVLATIMEVWKWWW